MQTWCPGIVGGWEWVEPRQAEGSPTILHMSLWLGLKNIEYPVPSMINNTVIENLQKHYGISQDRRLDGPSQTIKALQNEINQWVG